MTGGQKASDLRASSAIALARIAGKETYEPFKALTEKETAAQGVFGSALDRMQVANECDRDLACYGKKLNDPLVGALREGGVRDRVLGRRQEGRAAAAGRDEADHHDDPGALPGAPGDPVRAGAPRHQGLQGVHREAGQADRARREGGAPAGRARPAGRDARHRGDHHEQGRERRRRRRRKRRRPKKRPRPPAAKGGKGKAKPAKPAKPAKGKKKQK